MDKKHYWDMTKEEKEAMIGEFTKEEIAKHHAAGRPTVHGDDQGIFLIHPDGTKEYVELYPPCYDPLAWLKKPKPEPGP